MKNRILFSLAILLGANLYSQSFDETKLRLGGGFCYATKIENPGLSLIGAYEITDQWEASAQFTHIFKKNYSTWNVLDFDAHYNMYQKDESLNVYGMAGLSFTFWKVAFPETVMYGITIPAQTTTGSDIGLNLGVGLNYHLTEKLNLAPEMRFTIIDGSYLRLGATLQYMF